MEPKRGRGRPASVDANAVADIALALFIERGFDRVTMADIAERAGIGRRTLFRYFPSKFALVWGGATELNDSIIELLGVVDRPDRTVGAVIAEAYRAAYHAMPKPMLDLAQSRLRIIHRYPEVYAYGHSRWLEDRREIAEFIALREQRSATDLDVVLRAQLASSFTFSALIWWAERDGLDFFAVMDPACDDLQRRLDANG